MTIVFKASPNIQEKMIKYYEDLKREKTPPYAIFQAMEADTIITLYESGKAMFQGVSADIDANIWIDLERKFNNRIIDITTGKDKKDNKKEETKYDFNKYNTIGSDEVGTGDYFGPVVVCATFVSTDKHDLLKQLKVMDSKKLTDEKILEIAPIIMKEIPFAGYVLNNIDYNNSYNESLNMNKIKAVLHNKVLLSMVEKKLPYGKIIVDEFTPAKNYYGYLSEVPNKVTNITFTPKAEDKALSVACASIIARYRFIEEITKMSKKIGYDIPKGAGTIVDEFGTMLVKEKGFDILKEIAKLNFKNTDKIKELSQK